MIRGGSASGSSPARAEDADAHVPHRLVPVLPLLRGDANRRGGSGPRDGRGAGFAVPRAADAKRVSEGVLESALERTGAASRLKRAAFDPAIDLGFRKPVAVGLTFALSAAMHEYACYVAEVTTAASRGRAHSPLAGKQAAYFFFNFVALSIERAIERRSRRFREARPTIRLAIITVWLSWCTTLFVDVLERGGVMREIDELVGNPIFRLRRARVRGTDARRTKDVSSHASRPRDD